MKLITAHLKSCSPYGHRKPAQPERFPGELEDDLERRTWREHLHVTSDGYLYIPPQAFCKSVQSAAKYLNLKIPGERNATWTKNFASGIMVREPLILPVLAKDVPGQWLFLPANARPGPGTRVWRCFMALPSWEGAVTFDILDPKITVDVFERVLAAAGNLIGIGLYRPESRGFWGRFMIEEIHMSELAM